MYCFIVLSNEDSIKCHQKQGKTAGLIDHKSELRVGESLWTWHYELSDHHGVHFVLKLWQLLCHDQCYLERLC
jgi:hypothetical protein